MTTTDHVLRFDNNLKRRIEVVTEDEDILSITPLGAGNEVGRSCIILSFKGKTVMLDAGIHPAHEGIAGLPFYDNIDPDDIDLVLISHFHLDHAASLPYFMEKTSYSNPVYMTHPTKAIYKWFLTDYVRVSTASVDDMIFDEQDLLKSYEKITAIDYHQEVEVEGIKFTPYNAGHVLGAAMFLIEIAGVRVLYTGDYSREEDRHLMAAEHPKHVHPEVLICEATFGNQTHEPRLERETRFTSKVHEIVSRGGRCLIPVFALGRAQELLLILDEYWQAHPELDHVPIYFASSLAKKCMAVYQTYINMMNHHIRQQFSTSNPFVFKHIANLRHINSFEDNGPCVMVASPGMLQNGLSRELFERWCPDPRNGLVLCGYSVEGTLARSILTNPEKVPLMRGGKVALKMSVDYISFAAHVDFKQNSEFIELVSAPNLVLVHGEPIPMSRLRQALSQKYYNPNDPTSSSMETSDPSAPARRRMAIYTPKNTETIELRFSKQKVARTIGKLANLPIEAQLKAKIKAKADDEKNDETEEPSKADKVIESNEDLIKELIKQEAEEQGTELEGIILGRDFQYRIVHRDEMEDLAGLNVSTFHQTQTLRFDAKFELLIQALNRLVGKSSIVEIENGIEVLGIVQVFDHTEKSREVVLKWQGNEANDMIADGILAAILQMATSPASVKMTYNHDHNHEHKQESLSSKSIINSNVTSNDLLSCSFEAFSERFEQVQIIPNPNDPSKECIYIVKLPNEVWIDPVSLKIIKQNQINNKDTTDEIKTNDNDDKDNKNNNEKLNEKEKVNNSNLNKNENGVQQNNVESENEIQVNDDDPVIFFDLIDQILLRLRRMD